MLPIMESQHSASFSPGREASTRIDVAGPTPGNWYMMAALDRNVHLLDCNVRVVGRVEHWIQKDIITIVPVFQDYQDIMTFNTITGLQTYRFFVPEDAQEARINISKCSLRSASETQKKQRMERCPVTVSASAVSLPSVVSKSVNCSAGSGVECGLELPTVPATWHYVITHSAATSPVEFAISVELTGCRSSPRQTSPMLVNKIDTGVICGTAGKRPLQLIFPPAGGQAGAVCGPRIPLHRRNGPGFFSFDYVLPGNGTGPEVVSLKPGESTVLTFAITEADIGGTLAIEMAIIHPRGGTPLGSVREAVGCVGRGSLSSPTYNQSAGYTCPHGRLLSQNTSHSSKGIVFEQVLIPYPTPGTWYLTLTSHCYSNTDKRSGEEECTRHPVQVLFAIHSNSCISGSCGRYGECYQYVSAGVLFSSCSCLAGHRGWGCNDPELAVPDFSLLVATLLLTLTNMATLPAVVLALFRGHYTESLVYFSTLISSSLYHACNQDIYTVCVLNYTVLRFCDTFTGVLSCWVTLLAMSALPHSIRSLFHMLGAIGISLAVQHSAASNVTQAVPFVVGSLILTASWIWRCVVHRVCYPGAKYLLLYCIPGVIVAAGGQLCLQLAPGHAHRQYLLSAWHIAKGVALMLLLPESPCYDEPPKDKPVVVASRNQFQVQVPESSFKHLTDSNQSSVDDMAAVVRNDDQSSQHQL